MNTLQGYGSDSGDEGGEQSAVSVAGPSSARVGTAASKRARSASPTGVLGERGKATKAGRAKKATAAVGAHDGDDDDDDDDEEIGIDARDAFGLGSLGHSEGAQKIASRASGSTASSSSLVAAAPSVGTEVSEASNALLARPTDTEMHVNIPYKDLVKPIQGPDNPFSSKRLGAQQNNLSGHIESAVMNDFDFRNHYKTFETLGYVRNPSQFAADQYVGDQARAQALNGASAIELRNKGGAVGGRTATKEWRNKREGRNGDVSVVEGEGVYMGPWASWQGERHDVVGPSEDEIRRAEERSTLRKQEENEMREKRTQENERGTEKSVFHGKSLYDYQGRTYMHIPNDVDVNLHGDSGEEQCFLPKACVHTWTGHTKAVSAIRLFPKSGHLLLSASMDTKIKLWDVYHEGSCLRTFMGHTKAVKDICFSNDGRRFLSASYDRQIKLWDTETGQCIQAFSNGKIPHVVKFHPDEDKQHIFLAGMSDKKIVQFDTTTGEVTQEYDSHLGPVNTITFVDENRRFATTSDDKTMRTWDFDIPVVIKYVADPLMHSMPAVTMHPNKKWLACQSLDNQIVVYAADSFRQNRKKSFRGHDVAGYACQVGFSPDGRYLSSGDGNGNLVVWDWKSGRLLKRLRGHKEVVIAHEWLPHETVRSVQSGGIRGLVSMQALLTAR